jgi:hypothetical protein
MAEKDGKKSWVMVNRAPVLTLWAAVAAEVLGKGGNGNKVLALDLAAGGTHGPASSFSF